MLVAAVVSMLVAGFVTVTQAEQPAAAVPAACDPAAVMNHRLGELGRSDYAWTISPLPARIGGLTDLDEHTVVISPLVTCDLMTAFVNHEWMHVQQGHKYDLSARVYQAYGAYEVEKVADCGSMLMASTWTPYITQDRQENGNDCRTTSSPQRGR
jgi:hypothetical protein